MTSETKLDYGVKKARLDMIVMQGAKSIYGRLYVHHVSADD